MDAQRSGDELRETNEIGTIRERLAVLEQHLLEQQQQMAQQEAEIERLRGELAAAQEAPALIHPNSNSEKRAPAGRLASRRSLLKLGGVVGVAGAAAAVGVAHSTRTAYASGTAWQTGTVNADTETLVKPSSPSYSSADVLQLQLGTGTVYSPLGVQANAIKAALTAYDTTTDNIGVYATSSTGFGLVGVTNTGTGATGAGLNGTANSTGTGVSGNSQGGIGVQGNSAAGLGGVFTGGQAPLALGLASALGAPTSGAHYPGELYLDSAATLWICVTTGTPGTWVKMAHLAPGATSGGAITYLAKPIRLLDTRSGQPALNMPGSPYAGGSTHSLTVAGDSYNSVTVPASAVGAIGNVTVVNPSGGGYLALVPHGAGFSGTAILAFSAGQVVSNSFNVGLASGQLDIILGGSGSMTTDVILDLFAVVA